MGDIYLDIIETTGLPDTSNTVYANCQFQGRPETKVRTENQTVTQQALFNASFHLKSLMNTEVLEFHLWSRKFLGNESLGKAELALNQVKPGEKSEVWLQLQGVQGAGKLRINIGYYPEGYQKPIVVPKLEEFYHQGQLYVKVIEVKDIDRPKGPPDAVVTLGLGVEPKETLKTETAPKSHNPVFNMEYLFTVRSRKDEPLTVRVHNWGLLNYGNYGKTVVDLMKLQDNVVHDLWFKLEEVSKGEVHLLLRFVPLPVIDKIVNMKLPDFRMQLEREYYYPGEVIRGLVIYNSYQPLETRGIKIRFDGYSQNSWTRSEEHGHGKNRRVVTYYYDSKITYFNPIATLCGNPRGNDAKFKLNPNTYAFPFEFNLPMNIPPSYKGYYGENRYFVKAFIDIPWGFDKEIYQDIKMMVQYDSIRWQPSTAISNKTEGLFTGNQPIRVVASTSDVIYVGKRKPIRVQVFNDSNKKINELEIKLIAETTFVAEEKGTSRYNRSFFGWRRYHGLDQQHQTDVVVSTKLKGVGFPIDSHKSWEGEILLDIPEDVYPSLPKEVSPIIYRDYHISVSAITDGNIFTKTESKVCIGVMVGKIHPNFENINAPKQPMGDPYKILIAQLDDQKNINQYIPPPLIQNDGTTAYGNMNYNSNIFNNAIQPEQWFDETNAGDNWGQQISNGQLDPTAPLLDDNSMNQMNNNQMGQMNNNSMNQMNNNQMNNNQMNQMNNNQMNNNQMGQMNMNYNPMNISMNYNNNQMNSNQMNNNQMNQMNNNQMGQMNNSQMNNFH